MESVLKKTPGSEEWYRDFMAYLQSQKLDICPMQKEVSVYGDLNGVMKNNIIIHLARKLDDALANQIQDLQQQDSQDTGMIIRFQAYREDIVKVSGLLVRIAAVVSNHFNTEFELEEVQTDSALHPGSLNSDGLLEVGQEWIDRGFYVIKKAAIYDD